MAVNYYVKYYYGNPRFNYAGYTDTITYGNGSNFLTNREYSTTYTQFSLNAPKIYFISGVETYATTLDLNNYRAEDWVDRDYPTVNGFYSFANYLIAPNPNYRAFGILGNFEIAKFQSSNWSPSVLATFRDNIINLVNYNIVNNSLITDLGPDVNIDMWLDTFSGGYYHMPIVFNGNNPNADYTVTI